MIFHYQLFSWPHRWYIVFKNTVTIGIIFFEIMLYPNVIWYDPQKRPRSTELRIVVFQCFGIYYKALSCSNRFGIKISPSGNNKMNYIKISFTRSEVRNLRTFTITYRTNIKNFTFARRKNLITHNSLLCYDFTIYYYVFSIDILQKIR